MLKGRKATIISLERATAIILHYFCTFSNFIYELFRLLI